MPAPTTNEVASYLADAGMTPETGVLEAVYAAEKAAQAGVCVVPADADVWPSDLAEALMRRCAHNLAVRSLPLGFQAVVTDTAATSRNVGGTDAEVRRLELPYKRRVVG